MMHRRDEERSRLGSTDKERRKPLGRLYAKPLEKFRTGAVDPLCRICLIFFSVVIIIVAFNFAFYH